MSNQVARYTELSLMAHRVLQCPCNTTSYKCSMCSYLNEHCFDCDICDNHDAATCGNCQSKNEYRVWTEEAAEYHNANIDACDMWIGPCACGATHIIGEFEIKSNGLYRYNKLVVENK